MPIAIQNNLSFMLQTIKRFYIVFTSCLGSYFIGAELIGLFYKEHEVEMMSPLMIVFMLLFTGYVVFYKR